MGIAEKILSMDLSGLSHWGYWAIFLLTFAEAMPFGFFIPAHTLLIIGGFLAKNGILNGWLLAVFGISGAIIGDSLNYHLGRKYGVSLLEKYGEKFFFKKAYLEKTKELMHSHTGKTLIIGRFNPVTRFLAPFIAGVSKIRFVKFLRYNILGAIVWAGSGVAIGYIFGKGYEIAEKYIGGITFVVIIVAVLFAYGYRFVNKRSHIFTKYHLKALILNIASLYVFTKLLDDVMKNELITKVDAWINAWIMHIWNPGLTKAMLFITNIVSTKSMIMLSGILLCILIYRKNRHHAWLLTTSLAIAVASELIIKNFVHRLSPDNALIEVAGYSFPSEHAIASVVFFSFMIYAFKDEIINSLWKWIFVIGNILLFILIGFSRIYLSVNWLSDVVAGFALGLFWLTLFVIVFKIIIALRRKQIPIIKDI